MARSQYVYIVLCGHRRDHVLAPFTVKHEMRAFLKQQTRDDLTVKRFRDGSDQTGVIMTMADILEGK